MQPIRKNNHAEGRQNHINSLILSSNKCIVRSLFTCIYINYLLYLQTKMDIYLYI